jgi:hypothetical protein
VTRYTTFVVRTPLLVFLLLGTACSLDEGSGPGGVLDGGQVQDQWVPDDATDQPDSNPGIDASADATPDAPVDAKPPPDGGCVASACQGERCLNGSCDFYVSCSDMHQDLNRPTGPHKLRDPNKVVFDAWCDMNQDGGGWTLIGRSVVAGNSSNFGWKKSTGTINDDTKPYSLDVNVHDLVFTEALFGGYSLGKTWFGSLYKAVLPANFLANFKNSAGATTVSKIGGACTENSPTMFSNMGFVDNNDQFYMRDNTSSGNFGLRADGFALNYTDCAHAALLNTLPGMIAVR